MSADVHNLTLQIAEKVTDVQFRGAKQRKTPAIVAPARDLP
jgi:hypothetical protein